MFCWVFTLSHFLPEIPWFISGFFLVHYFSIHLSACDCSCSLPPSLSLHYPSNERERGGGGKERGSTSLLKMNQEAQNSCCPPLKFTLIKAKALKRINKSVVVVSPYENGSQFWLLGFAFISGFLPRFCWLS